MTKSRNTGIQYFEANAWHTYEVVRGPAGPHSVGLGLSKIYVRGNRWISPKTFGGLSLSSYVDSAASLNTVSVYDMSQVDNQKGAPGFMPEEMCVHILMVKNCLSTNLRRLYIIKVHMHLHHHWVKSPPAQHRPTYRLWFFYITGSLHICPPVQHQPTEKSPLTINWY